MKIDKLKIKAEWKGEEESGFFCVGGVDYSAYDVCISTISPTKKISCRYKQNELQACFKRICLFDVSNIVVAKQFTLPASN